MTILAKRKRGRPPIHTSGGHAPEIGVSLAPSTLAELRMIAAAHEMSVGAVIRTAIGIFLRDPRRPPSPDAPPAPPVATVPDPAIATARVSRAVVRRGRI